MKWNDIIQQVVVSGLISGFLIFLLQQWILSRFKTTEKRLELQLKFQQNAYESTVQGFKAISDQLLNLEDYIRNNIYEDIRNGVFDPNNWKMIFDTQNVIRKSSIAIPENLYRRSIDLLEKFSNDLNKIGDYMREIQERVQKKDVSLAEYKSNMDDRMNTAYKNFRNNVDMLRTDFRKISEDIFFSNKVESTELASQRD